MNEEYPQFYSGPAQALALAPYHQPPTTMQVLAAEPHLTATEIVARTNDGLGRLEAEMLAGPLAPLLRRYGR